MPPFPQQRISEAQFAAIDFESAGTTRGATDAPVQIGIATMSGGVIDTESLFRSYIATDREITWAAQKTHGITRDDLRDAPTLLSLWPEIQSRLAGRIIVAHSASTEKRFLRAFPYHGLGPWVDSLKLVRASFPRLEKHSLGDSLEQLGLKDEADALCPGLNWHDALYDSVASLVLLRHVVKAAKVEQESVSLLGEPDLALYHRLRR